jgi:AcrR family transcriptional regulator
MEAENSPGPRLRIIEAAGRLLRDSPDGQVSTREICREAGVTAPTLYHHFGDKDRLLDDVVADGFGRYLQRKRAVSRSGDPAQDLRSGWDMHVTFGVTHPAFYRLMFGNAGTGRTPPAAVAAHRELRDIVTGWERSGRLLLPIESATGILHAAAVGTTFQLITLGVDSDHPLSRQIRDMVAAALLRPAPASSRAVSPAVAQLARDLRSALPSGPIGSLRATETALLHEWLTDLGAATEPGKG